MRVVLLLWYHLSAVCKVREGQERNWKEAWAEAEEQPERKMGRWGRTPGSEMETGRQRNCTRSRDARKQSQKSYQRHRGTEQRQPGVGVRLRARHPSTGTTGRNLAIRRKQKLRTCPRDGCLGTKGGACFADTSSWSSTDVTQHLSGGAMSVNHSGHEKPVCRLRHSIWQKKWWQGRSGVWREEGQTQRADKIDQR